MIETGIRNLYNFSVTLPIVTENVKNVVLSYNMT